MLTWTSLDPATLERAVQMLVRDRFGAVSVDGSGGDDAQDLRSDESGSLTIYEIKSFPARLTKAQQRQIKRSCLRAIELHTPARWVLIIPLNHSPAEFAWFERLRAEVAPTSLEWWGKDWLDGQFANRDDLVSYVEGVDSQLLRRAQQFGQETAALATGQELFRREAALQQRADAISPYWTWRSGVTPWGPGHVLHAQRPESAVDDPIVISSHFSFDRDDPESHAMLDRLQEVIRFGGDVEVPGSYIEQFTVTAASEATQRLLGDEQQRIDGLRLVSLPDESWRPLVGAFVCTRSSGEAGPSVPFTVTQRTGGLEGATFAGRDPSGYLRGQFVVRQDSRVCGPLQVELRSTAGAQPDAVLPAVEFFAQCRPGDRVDLRIGPVTAATFTADSGRPDGIDGLHQLVWALSVLQQHLGVLLPIPSEPMSDEESKTLLAAALALTGGRARLWYDGLDLTIRPGRRTHFLQSTAPAPGAIYGTAPDVRITIDGASYDVPGMALWLPNAILVNRAELEAASDDNEPHTASFEAQDDSGVWLLPAVNDPGPEFTAIHNAS